MKQKTKLLLLIVVIVLIGIKASLSYSNFLYGQIAVVIAVSILVLYGALRKDPYRRDEIKKLPVSSIKDISGGFVKIKGKIQGRSTLTSKLTRSNCIGYHYSAMKWSYKKNDGKSKRDRFQVFDAETKCNDFYVYDSSGKIKVIAQDITIMSDLNHHKKVKNKGLTDEIIYTENVLLANQQEYYLIGNVVKKDNVLVFLKDEENDLIIASPNEFDILFTSNGYRFGCAVFIIFILLFLVYLYNHFLSAS